MRIGSLFSGYGGAEMAVQSVWPDARPAWFVEFDKAPSKVLAHHWPDVPNYGDVTAVDWSAVEPVDILTGGYPCQPFSHAGQRRGTDDERHLWPCVADALRALRPRLALFENVAGHLSLGFDAVLADLAALGMDVRWGVVRASDAGAPHRRARLFIIATDRDTHGAVVGNGAQRRAGVRPVVGQGAYAGGVGAPASDTSGGPLSGVAATGDGLPVAAERGGVSAADTDEPGLQGQGEFGGGRSSERTTGADGLVTTADTGSERHGPGQDSRSVGPVDGPDEGGARERQRSREEPGDRSTAAPAHPDSSTGAQPNSHEATGCSVPVGDDAQRPRVRRDVDYGPYEAAIQRWECIIGRPAPAPTVPTGRNNGHRLNPVLVEFMMGLPEGHVTATPGLSRVAQLKMLGNGIVPQQMALALRLLLDEATP